MNINELITQIPEDTDDEALLAVQTVVVDPARESARLTCHLMHEYRIEVALSLGLIRISAENRTDVFTDVGGFLGQLKRQIYKIDEAIEAGLILRRHLSLSSLLTCLLHPLIWISQFGIIKQAHGTTPSTDMKRSCDGRLHNSEISKSHLDTH